MPLAEITTKEKTEIVYSPTSDMALDPTASFVMVRTFKYEYKGVKPPSLKEVEGDIYLMPLNIKVHPKTTLDDVDWIKPKPPAITYEVESTDKTKKYKVKQRGDKWTCTCQGYQRLWNKDKGCIHINSLK